MSIINNISESIILPLSDVITGQSVYKHLQFLQNSQYWSRDEITNFQLSKLKSLLNHSALHVPYFKQLFSNIGLNPSDIKTLDDLVKIPLLNKKVIKEVGIGMLTSNGIPKNNMILGSSSGSTGQPLFYYKTKDSYSLNLATSLRGWYWMGYRLGDKFIKLSQNPRNNPLKRLQDKMSRNLYLATNPLIDSNFEFILQEIEQYKPKIIRCYPDPLLFLARYKSNHKNFKFNPLAITTTGNTLHQETRIEIETIFNTKIFDSYSCEGNSTIFECPTHTCYHSSEEYGISEVLGEDGLPLKSGIGRLISTDLWNLAFPFIRYDTQDLVEISDEECLCGRKLKRINKIIGRDNDILLSRSGRKFIVHNFTGFFQSHLKQLKKSIDQFQIIHLKNGNLLFRIMVNKDFDLSVQEFITTFWQKEFGSPIEIEIVDNISLTLSGKRRFIINENK